MKRLSLSVLLLVALFFTSVFPVFAAPPIDDPETIVAGGPDEVGRSDNRPDPMTEEQKALKEQALQAKLNGKAKGKVHEVARGQYVELERTGQGMIWTVLGEFADMKHNEMPEPDRSVNNTDMWVPDFSRDHYMDLLFNDAKGANSMRNFYVEQSSNRYTVAGDVTDWIEVSGPAASYDDDFNNPAGGNQVWYFLDETIDGWYAQQVAAGQTPEQINAYLAQFDVWDRYDYDGDSNFNEPDGYIDTFQSVHAGVGNESCSPGCDDWAIWSHSWYAFQSRRGVAGPEFNKLGGVQVGDSNYWVGKYTIQPENGGVGVFTHEYGHDLGLPDLYDTSGGENGTAFWTLMSSGSWMGDGTVDIGSKSSHMGAWEKFRLGWLNYEVAFAGQKSVHKLGPMEFNTKQAQALFVILPQKPVVSTIGTPYAGAQFYYSGSGDNLDNFMYKSFTLPAGAVSLSAMVRHNIELNWDYAYLVVSTDGGANWTPVQTNLSVTTNPNGQNFGFGITGVRNTWTALTADLSGYAGQTVLLGFRYWTDTNTGGYGFMLDDLNVTGFPVDGAEADAGWTFEGFRTSTGQETTYYSHYYVAEFRTYLGYDSTLKTGPYNFGFQDNPLLLDWVEHFPYQSGLLINYWDTSQRNNNVRQHPGAGLILPVDAHPTAMIRADGGVWRNRISSFDSTFGLTPTTPLTLHWRSAPSEHPSLPAVPVFDDRNSYYDPANPWGSVITPNTGTQITVQSISAQNTFMLVDVRPVK